MANTYFSSSLILIGSHFLGTLSMIHGLSGLVGLRDEPLYHVALHYMFTCKLAQDM